MSTSNAERTDSNAPERPHDSGRMYLRFGLMIATSTVVMFILMYLNTYQWSHVRFSETRAYMALVMGAAMAVVMLSFMLGMYKSVKWNIGIYLGRSWCSPWRWGWCARRSRSRTSRTCAR